MLLQLLENEIKQIGEDKHFLVAYSGGMDSHVLLSLCVLLRQQFQLNLQAIHINHGISSHAKTWEYHCKHVCQAYDIPFITHHLSYTHVAGESLEERARIKRYESIATHMTEQTVLLTAHHQDDQAETFLLQLMRGAGLKGLSAMPRMKRFVSGWHARPLLTTSRENLRLFAIEQQLSWVEDESNVNDRWSRNYLRQQIMPLLNNRWTGAATMIARSANHCAEAQSLLLEQVDAMNANVMGTHSQTLSVNRLKQLPTMMQKQILRNWIQQQGYVLPNVKKLAAIMTQVFDAAHDRSPMVLFGHACVRRYRDDLFLLRHSSAMSIEADFQLNWDLNKNLLLPDGQQLSALKVIGQGLRTSLTQVAIKFRQGGEVIYLPHRGHRSLKKMFNEWGVLPWQRSQIPLLFVENELIAVVGYYYHPEWVVQTSEIGLTLQLS
jgi:tRNA(Ile)-lysidine synthase